MIRWLLTKIAATALALWLADYLLSGFSISGGLKGYLIAGAVLGLLNGLVRPVIKLVTLPLIWLTLGLFTVVINMAMLWLSAGITGLITIEGLATLSWATLIVSVMNIVSDGSTD